MATSGPGAIHLLNGLYPHARRGSHALMLDNPAQHRTAICESIGVPVNIKP
jgi:hypothetical protein